MSDLISQAAIFVTEEAKLITRTNQNMDQLLTLAIQAAVAAGNEIMKVYNEADFKIELKSDNSPLTKADKAAHQIITSYLANTLPILSEEGKAIPYEIRKDWGKYWLIDPLDGTKEFIKKNGEFTVNIALIDNKVPVLGVIFAPAIGWLYYADSNGAFRCPFHVSQAAGNTLNLSQAEKLPYKLNTMIMLSLGVVLISIPKLKFL